MTEKKKEKDYMYQSGKGKGRTLEAAFESLHR